MNNSSFFHWLKGCVYLFIPFLLVYLTVMAVCFGYFFFSPNIVGWSLHNTLDASNCIEVLKNAIAKYGAPEIINSDQGRQFTCLDWKDQYGRPGPGKGQHLDRKILENDKI